MRDRIVKTRYQHGDGWIERFVEFYLGQQRTCDAADGCTVTSLAAEIERPDNDTRSSYQNEIEDVVAAIADDLIGESDRRKIKRAWVFLAMLDNVFMSTVSHKRGSRESRSGSRIGYNRER